MMNDDIAPSAQDTYRAGETITLRDDTGRQSAFTVIRAVGVDAQAPTAVYEAERIGSEGMGQRGRLVTFRDESGRSSGGAKRASAYRALRRLARGDDSYAFLPPFDVCVGNGGRTVIWLEDVGASTFEDVCENLLLSDRETAAEALCDIVAALHDLADCLALLHAGGFALGGLSGTQVGFRQQTDGAPSRQISLLDLSTLTQAQRKADGNPDMLRDAQSIGRILSRALGAGGIAGGAATADAMHRAVTGVFELKGQEPPEGEGATWQMAELMAVTVPDAPAAMPTCEEISRRLGAIEDKLIPLLPAAQDRLKRGHAIEVVDREARRQNQVRAVFQYLLNDRPLYRWQDREAQEYKVVLLGFGLDSQRFLDVCLETAQSMDQRIHVDVWDGHGLGKERDGYLRRRPALSQFFLVTGREGDLTGDPYGVIDFHSDADGGAFPDSWLEEMASGHNDARYAYIAVGRDRENARIARTLALLFGGSAAVNAQCEEKTPDGEGVHYVWVNANVEEDASYAELDRMSLNAHLTWNPSLNADLDQAVAAYRSDYYHSSSLAYVLSITYKLHYLGIDLSDGPIRAAEALLASPPDEATRERMGVEEHRRWNTSLLCDGWRSMTVADSIKYGGTKDKAGRRHVCLVRSDDRPRPDMWNDHGAWDAPTDAFLDQLDDLDRMSVTLHKQYLDYADAYGADYSSVERTMQDASEEIVSVNSLNWIFAEWCVCIREIFDASSKRGHDATATAESRLLEYERLYGRLRKDVDGERGRDRMWRKSVIGKLDSIHASFAPVVRRLEYHDYKKNDTDLIDGIPFILTYSTDLAMIVPANYAALSSSRDDKKQDLTSFMARTTATPGGYKPHDNTPFPALDQLFSYVAAATIVNPRILYVPYIARQDADPAAERARRAWEACLKSYARGKGLQTDIRFLPLKEKRSLEDILQLAGGARPRRLLVERNRNTDKVLAGGLDGLDAVAEYSFDMLGMRFSGDGAMWLNSIHRPDAGLTTRDVANFLGRKIVVKNQPSFGGIDVDILFATYQRNRGYWKATCQMLKDPYDVSARDADANPAPVPYADLVRFRRIRRPLSYEPTTATRFYFLPYACHDAAETILGLLKEKGIIGKRSRLLRYSADSCKVIIFEYRDGEYKTELDALFARQYLLAMERDYRIEERDDGFVLQDNALEFRSVPFDSRRRGGDGAPDKQAAGMRSILLAFHRQGLIRFIEHEDAKTCDVIYGGAQAKDLLMVEGRILEIYVYHKCRELAGEFDDVVSGVTFLPANADNPENKAIEVDCLVTRGFQVLMLECKARNYDRPGEETQFEIAKSRLYRNAHRLCINGRALLVLENADGTVPPSRDFEGVEVCADHEAISDLGHVVLRQFTER